MDKLSLKANERTVLGKGVRHLRRDGLIPGHVYGRKVEVEHVSVPLKDFIHVARQAGETGLINLKIGEEKVRPVMIRGIQHHPQTGQPLHIDFYQVNLKEKVTVPVPIVLIGEEPESVHLGETVVLQNLSEVQVEALPSDLIEKIEVDITSLKQIDDAVTVSQLNYDRELLTLLAEPDEVVVKIAPAITDEMKRLMEEQEAEAQAAAAAEGETPEEQAASEATEGEAAEGEAGESTEGQKEESNNEEQPQ